MADNIKYSEAFKRQVVDELARGRHQSIESARRAYGIKGSMTVTHWVRRYGSTDLLPKRIRIETMKETSELKEARKRIRELETALANAHIENCLERGFLKTACIRLGENVEDFKKKPI
jgi:transposase-like protein